MPDPDTNNCELPSEKIYKQLKSVQETETSKKFCNLDEKLLNKYPVIKDFCLILASNLELSKEKEESTIKELCTYLKHWLNDSVINTVERKSVIIYISLLHTVFDSFNNYGKLSSIKECNTSFPTIAIDHFQKWKNMQDYKDDYAELQSAFKKNEDCMEDCIETCEECVDDCNEDCKNKYCLYFLDIFNTHKEFEYVCNGKTSQKCPDFGDNFKANYSATSYIESKCKEVYENLGYYKVKVPFGEQGEEEYVEQYEATYMFSFFEKLIGYSIKKFLSRSLHYSKYIVLPILSFFGSKIAPKADDMRNMWRNVQGVTNPASLLNPMKPPGGGNKMGLPYLPK
ncbi:PIR Superfamily Protein [Plasmodium ovale curtisi]|uniref:PIR Superfamily Protein n=1 Tax=Plasmodium ovale curtisi TaxID=864141 RepID=A0A1A8WS16_PLAOA|nr:PIR Superfamily Protein [Plasmodium ovale curtisi]